MDFAPVKGTRDFYPEDLAIRRELFRRFRLTAAKFNFQEYDSCVLESEELFIRKAGDEITGQLYNFTDKGNRRLALRPEMTPSLTRMLISRIKSLQLPLKWFSIPQCFRYERMQKGRKREHFQWNMDIIGDGSLNAEAELMAAAIDFCVSSGLKSEDIVIKFSNRHLLQELFTEAGFPPERLNEVFVIIDKREKIGPEKTSAMLIEAGFSEESVKKTEDILGASSIEDIEQNSGLRLQSKAEIEKLLEISENYGIREFLELDISIVRGLSYYTGTVFELKDKEGKHRTICGGGRYDNLMENLGGPSVPMAGFGFGDVIISEILSSKGMLTPPPSQCRTAVASLTDDGIMVAVKVASGLRKKGKCVELKTNPSKIKKLISSASRSGYEELYIVAPEELLRGCVVYKNLKERTEKELPISEIGEKGI
ncbi:MAG: histidine--tRNA ligase [Fibrobacterota bacterium]